ncbi:glycosyltransferase [Pedobacter frigidisoli]|uniref:Glycosyltransferase n=1 Tax=Pedobacter frigidisoli TaxID=2530455 RepID=A0A4R0P3H6_9SPHI|nr:glycosyltransferase family 2 protein [Pedobacter frigidisoli]TCD07734.1 glycosyltransferase [Pedobacter frigidisoli]
MPNTFFSVIIPTYNSEKTLGDALESLYKQTFEQYEICIVDACSFDRTHEIIEHYRGIGLNINFIHENDKGIYDAMNKGIGMSKGAWLYFLGSDDTLYDSNVLTRMNQLITQCKADVVYGNVLMNGKNQWNLDGVIFAGEYDLSRILNLNICHQAMFYNRNIFKQLGCFDIKYNVGADYEFNLRCFANVSFQYVPITIANFFVGGYSTKTEDQYFHQERGSILYRYFKLRIFENSFIPARLYLQRAFFNPQSSLTIIERAICISAYLKLKMMALIKNQA